MTKAELTETLTADGWKEKDGKLTKPVPGSRLMRTITVHPNGVYAACSLSMPAAQVAGSLEAALAWANGKADALSTLWVDTPEWLAKTIPA